MTVFVAQAVDDSVNFLRNPLNPAVLRSSHAIKNLVIIGGCTRQTRPLSESITTMLKDRAHELHTFETLTAVDFRLIDADTTTVSLSELDKPVFEAMTSEEWLSFKTLFSAPTKLFLGHQRSAS